MSLKHARRAGRGLKAMFLQEEKVMQHIPVVLLAASFFLFQTADSQNGWTVHGSNINSISCIKAVDQNVAWIAGFQGGVSLTTDGGSTWTRAESLAVGGGGLFNIDALSATIAFVTTTTFGGTPDTTYIYRTTNGGTSWSQVYSQVGGFVDDIHMFDSTNGIAQGDPIDTTWTVLRTTDGGQTWTHLPHEPTSMPGEFGSLYNCLFVLDSAYIWFTSSSNRVYRSTDGGDTWSFSTLPTNYGLSVWFNSLNLGLVTSDRTTGARSTDGGATWNSIPFVGSGSPYSIAGAGTIDFWYASDQIYHSTDRGSSWTNELSGQQWMVLDFVTIGNTAVGYAASAGGAVARYSGTVTSVGRTNGNVGGDFALEQNYPNPFNPSTTIKYELAKSTEVKLSVYDMLGREVSVLVDVRKEAGVYEVKLDGSNLASGVYFYRLTAGSYVQTRKLLLLW
jgi:photosystem II stability/assembly factor-like uncharacterized protein